MPFLQLTIDIDRHDPTPIEDALFDLGALSVTLEDAADDPVLEPAPGETPLWPTITLKAIFDAATDPTALQGALSEQLPRTLPPPRFETLADKAWEREWL